MCEKSDTVKWFEERHLKGTCFSTLEELLKDKTTVFANAPRALIACNLKGVWKGICDVWGRTCQ